MSRKLSLPEYGNVTLSQITRFIVEVIGKDALLAQTSISDEEINDAYKEKGSFYKYKFIGKDSIFGRIKDFFSGLESEFNLEVHEVTRKSSFDGSKWATYYESKFTTFYYAILWELFVAIGGGRPFETKQYVYTNRNIVRLIFIQTSPIYISYIHHAKNLRFDTLLESAKKELNISYEKIYKEIAEAYYKNHKNEQDAEEHIKRAIQKTRKENKNPTWNILHAILVTLKNHNIKTSLIEHFLDFYFYNNFRSNAIQHISLSKDTWLEIENLTEQSHSPEEIHTLFIDSFYNESILTLEQQGQYFDAVTQGNSIDNFFQFTKDYPAIKKDLPHSFAFWDKWFEGKNYVYDFLDTGDIEKLPLAIHAYKEAFEKGKYFAGKNLTAFLQEAISVCAYYDIKHDLKGFRNRILQCSRLDSGIKTPLSQNIKFFYDFAYCFDMVLNEMQDAFAVYYFCMQNFWSRFSPLSNHTKQIRVEDIHKSLGFLPEPEKDFFKKEEEKLLSVTDRTINTLIDDGRLVIYTPISFAIWCKKYDIVYKFLDTHSFPNLNLNIPNTNNTFPITEILAQYNHFHTDEDKNLLFDILKRTEKKTLFSRSNRSKRSVFQLALDSFDFEIVQAFVNKMTVNGREKFKDSFLISSDEVIPLYYAIGRREVLLLSKERYLSKLQNREGDINYRNYFQAGFSEIQKDESNVFLKNTTVKQKLFSQFYNEQNQNREEKLKQSDKIIDLLIKNTKNIDSVKYRSDDPTQGCSPLLYAAELDDVETCKKLLDSGANIMLTVGKFCINQTSQEKYLYMPNSILTRAIHYCSWKVLDYIFEIHKDKLTEITKRDDKDLSYVDYFLRELANKKDRKKIEKHFLTFIKQL